MPLILPGNVASATASTGYNIDNSCRFNAGSTDSLSRTPPSAGNQKTFTISVWFKISKLTFTDSGGGDSREIIGQSAVAGNYFRAMLEGGNNGTLRVYSNNSFNLKTNRLFRDVSAWYHLLVVIDTTQGTASNRAKIYINGVQETSFSTETYPSQDTDMSFNNSRIHSIGRTTYAGGYDYYDGYMSEVVFIDGQALDPTSFGEFDSDSPTIWKPIDVSGLTFGTNGFYLDFEDSSALGNDVSGNDNDFTSNNLDATDQTTDTPTNNFCTLNSLDNYYASYTFSEGNCKIDGTPSPTTYRTGTMGVASGKWYWEVNITAAPASNASRIGFTSVVSTSTTHILGSDIYGWAQNGNNGNIEGQASQSGSAASTAYGNSHTTDDIIGIALNLDDDEVKFYKNGTVENSGTAFQINKANAPNGFFFPAIGEASTENSITAIANFGNPAWALSSAVNDENGYGNFEYSVPSGFLALCTKNLAEYG